MIGITSPPESNRRSKHRTGIRRFSVRRMTQMSVLAGGLHAPNAGAAAANRCGTSVFQPGLTPRRVGLFPLCKPRRLCYTQPGAKHCFALFLGSSVVEQPAVNRLVAGSNPARGATPHALPGNSRRL